MSSESLTTAAMLETQLPGFLRQVVDEQFAIFQLGRSVTNFNAIPPTDRIPIENQRHWLKIPNVICVFVDMKGSTRLSATNRDQDSAGAYQLFTGTAVRLFHELDTPYIDVRGDGVFALFNQDQVYRALAAAITFKTFAKEIFAPEIKKLTGEDIGAHIGVDQQTVLVRRVGLKRHNDRSDRQNEVWAGKPINMASKLAAMGGNDELLVSERYYRQITSDLVRWSCGCPNGEPTHLWTEVPIGEEHQFNFDFDSAYRLKSAWCRTHGKKFCEDILALDEA